MIYPNVWMIHPFLGKDIQKFWGRNSTSIPHHHDHYSRNTWRPVGVSGSKKLISQKNRRGPCTWRSTITYSLHRGVLPRILRSWIYLERLKILQTTQINYQRNPTESQQRNNQPTPGTSHPGCWNTQKGYWEKNQERKIILVAQGTPYWKSSVGTPQARRFREPEQYLIE